MYLSLNWLKDFVDIPKSITPEKLGELLTLHTVEIDSVEKQSEKFANIVVGKILEIKKHPNADRLQLTKVDVGNKKLSIVCGAPNIKVGQIVPVALVGAVMPGLSARGGSALGGEIKEAEVRGEKSFGMLCAEDELGVGDDHSGIMILDKKAKVGQNFGEYLGLKDVIFEVDNKSITNRPDLWSHYGMAREISAFLGTKLKKYDINIIKSDNANIKINAKVEDEKLCQRYMTIAMDEIKIEDSPKWIQERLISAGMRPINNIVDITNYVMLELGQPLHAFDKKLISDNQIIIRKAKKDEIFETLDGEKRKMDSDMLVIADKKKPVAVAGVMGGANSEIENNTKSIIIESANFNFISIRKTSQKLGLRTESSIRFEKDLDPNLPEMALARAIELVKKICPKAKITSNLVDVKNFKINEKKIEMGLEWINKKIGKEMDSKQIIKILTDLGFGVIEDDNKFKVKIPSWRAGRDISIPEDLVEEIARIYGYNNLEPVMPKVEMQVPKINNDKAVERKIKNILAGIGLTEVYNYSFVCEDELKKININFSSYIKLANPISSRHTILRQNLIPGLLGNVIVNQAKFEKFELFEIGNIFLDSPSDIMKDNKSKETLPYQEKHLGIIVADDKSDVFSKAKGIVEYLFFGLNLKANFTKVEMELGWADNDVIANININNKRVGVIAQINNKARNAMNIKKKAVAIEIDLKDVFNLINNVETKKYKEFAKHPPVIRDLAFVVNEKILYNDIRDEIIGFNKLINSVELFDVYSGGKIGANKKSLAFHIIYQADKTLTSEEVDDIQKKLIKHLEKKFEAKIRDF
ncbi:MAG: phenylalanine--tRNA ligase subunit beta [Candidatus Falkowbacteria bacterium]